MHEAELHEDNCFVTLTYDDDNLPPGGSLDRRAFQLFMKRLRKAYDGAIRYYHCGEYGDVTARPHYHAVLFGIAFDDRYLWAERQGNKSFRSPTLERAWPLGNAEIGSVTFESAAYVARYCVKKVTGEKAEAHYSKVDVDTGELVQLEPEYATMSRRPGIGSGWLDKYGEETYRDDSVVMRGKEMKPPKYYDGKYELVDPERVADVKAARQRGRDLAEERPDRLFSKEKCAVARLNLRERRTV